MTTVTAPLTLDAFRAILASADLRLPEAMIPVAFAGALHLKAQVAELSVYLAQITKPDHPE